MLAVSFLTDFARESSKYFGGLILASQSIRDFVPDHKDTDTVTKIRTLFELTQYKFIMQQDSNTLDSLRTIFEGDRKSTRLNSSHVAISYAVFCLKKKMKKEYENYIQ